MWVRIRADGLPIEGSRLFLGGTPSSGNYPVEFDRDVSHCAYNVTPFDRGVYVQAQPLKGRPDGVSVTLADSTGAATNGEFYLSVTC